MNWSLTYTYTKFYVNIIKYQTNNTTPGLPYYFAKKNKILIQLKY